MADSLTQLIQLLQEDRAKILRGEIKALVQQSAAREKQFTSVLRLSPPSSEGLKSLRALAAGNAKLLQSAIAGMKDARSRVFRKKGPQPTLSTYSRTGHAMSLGNAHSGLELKA